MVVETVISTDKCEYMSLGRKEIYEVCICGGRAKKAVNLKDMMSVMVMFTNTCTCVLLQVLQHYPRITAKIYTHLLLIVNSELARAEEPDIVRNGQVVA